MAIDIKFDLLGNPEPPTIILANRNGNKLGQLKVNEDSIEVADKLKISEFSFTINKYYNDELTPLWDKVVDFKLVYCDEWDMWFEIKIEIDEENDTVKTVFCTQLGQAELSQINLYNVEINTEKDIERDDYKISILYDENDPKASILDRVLEKAPHYRIAYVSPTIAKIQRSFSFNGTSIYDSYEEIGEEIGCLFDYPSNSNGDRRICRDIYVYDLQQNCNECGHRGEYTDRCPKCGSTNITYGYGEDTLIFVTSDELASSDIKLVTDTDSVKNCFKLEAGDDLMTATVRNCNPNGTDYIWYFSDDLKEDMPDELVEKLDSYNKQYRYYYNEHMSDIDENILNDYNALVDKYSVYNKDLQKVKTPIIGYYALMNAYYNTIDLALFLKSVLMPSVEISGTTAEEQAKLLIPSSLSPVAVANINTASLATMNSAVLAMAKIIVKSTYKVQVKTSELIENGDNKLWKGNFVITNYSDEEDVATSEIIEVEVNGDLETFIKQKIDKALNKENTDDLSISGLFEKDYDVFCNELKKYALNPLISFRDACQVCIDILIEQGVANGNSWSGNDDSESNLYDNLYSPYYNKLMAIEAEIKIRENEINIVSGVYDAEGNLVTKGLQTYIEEHKAYIQNALNFEDYLGNELWLDFCAYRREDKYSNENYISDGLDNAELFKRALEFFEVAENEIYKSAELQHSISTTLNNLLAIPKFKDLVKSFKVGNWIRVQIDDRIFKLRLLEYGIDFGDFDNIPVEFSDVTKIKNGITDVKDILSKASSMATSYSSTKRQASQGAKSTSVLNNWVESGLNATQTKIVDSVDENLMFGKNAFWCRQYDPITDTYSDEQIKIVNSTIAITDDNWATTKTAIGKYYYLDPITNELKSAYGVNGETIVGKLLIGEQMSMQNESGSMIFDDNGMTITSVTDDGVGTMTFNEDGFIVNHGDNTVTISPKSKEVMNITNGEDKVFEVNENGELSINGNIIARSLRLENGVTIDSGVITNLATVATSGNYNDLNNTPNLSKVATTGSYNDLNNKPINDKVIEEVLYTEFEQLAGWYDKNGSIGQTSDRVHSQLLQINGGTNYYLGYVIDVSGGAEYECSGAFFDNSGNLIGTLLTADITQYNYKVPNGNSNNAENYVQLYTFKSPANAAYFSYNLAVGSSKKYRQFISSKPIFMLNNTGNYIIYKGDPVYQEKKDKKLCVIGASGVMIDRRLSADANNQYIVGFQEYLTLWYKKVDSYGFSSGGWGKYNGASSTTIYEGVVEKNLDLSEYDEFLLLPSTANINTTGIGEITDNEIGSEQSSYMAGLNAVINHIYSQVPLAKIYLANLLHKGVYFKDEETKANIDEINKKLMELSAYNSYQLIDLVGGSGINGNTYLDLTYDKIHLNHKGNKIQGLFIRKEIIGI